MKKSYHNILSVISRELKNIFRTEKLGQFSRNTEREHEYTLMWNVLCGTIFIIHTLHIEHIHVRWCQSYLVVDI